jgi:surface protein
MAEVPSMQALGGDSGQAEKEEQLAVSPIKEEAYFFIKCLYRLRKMYKLQGFNPDFIHKIFGPYILNKLSRCDGDIQAAVDLWCDDRAAAEKQYGNITKWDVSEVANMDWMFNHAYAFIQPIGNWDVSKVENMERMFSDVTAFNQPIGNWDVSKVDNMENMFFSARAFNQPIGNWDVSKVQSMRRMFNYAGSFNQPIGNWDVSKVENMERMFSGATAFNQPIGNWDVSKGWTR